MGVTSNGQTTTPVNIDVPASTLPGDVVVIIAESANTGATVTASNYTSLFAQEQTAGTGTTILTLLARVLAAAESTTVSVAVAGAFNHWSARSIVIRGSGCTTTSDIVVSAGNQGAASTTGTALGITVAVESLILMCGSTALDAASSTVYSAQTNTNLSAITERMDNCVSTNNGGGFGMASGICAITTTGNSTWTQTSEAWNGVHLGFPPLNVKLLPKQFQPVPLIPPGRAM